MNTKLGTYRIYMNGHVVVSYLVAANNWPADRAYCSMQLPEEYFDAHTESCGLGVHLIGPVSTAPEDVEHHFGLALGTEVLLATFRAAEAQLKSLGKDAQPDDLVAVVRMMTRIHDALAMAMQKRKMGL